MLAMRGDCEQLKRQLVERYGRTSPKAVTAFERD